MIIWTATARICAIKCIYAGNQLIQPRIESCLGSSPGILYGEVRLDSVYRKKIGKVLIFRRSILTRFLNEVTATQPLSLLPSFTEEPQIFDHFSSWSK